MVGGGGVNLPLSKIFKKDATNQKCLPLLGNHTPFSKHLIHIISTKVLDDVKDCKKINPSDNDSITKINNLSIKYFV